MLHNPIKIQQNTEAHESMVESPNDLWEREIVAVPTGKFWQDFLTASSENLRQLHRPRHTSQYYVRNNLQALTNTMKPFQFPGAHTMQQSQAGQRDRPLRSK
ncbi:hypothetical protein CANMA_001964 [Candida margitis]|uniref:uncharacterized protein n=1 Tax=Candida margitis TaxID=1775924 RepID=UPI002226333A|nr:uncharacterized protein CANMA_001964 [Candida margitis]KAI5968968.1 hypothetical protein CANMA_001964 [Candida margitis]